MTFFRSLRRGARALVRGRDNDREIADEVQSFVDEAADEYERGGMSRAAAVRAATIDVGTRTAAREEIRSFGWEHRIETVVADLRYALRRLQRSPGFTLIAATTFALGIGAATAIFSAISPILIQPLPFPEASRVVTLDDRNAMGAPMPVTFGTFAEIRARARSFERLAVADAWRPSISGAGDPEQLRGQRVTADYFSVYKVSPAVGRAFSSEDEVPGGARVVVLSDALVQRRFAGRGVIGQTILLDGDPHTVVGIMPVSFFNAIAPGIELWAPLRDRATGDFNTREWGHHYKMIGRVAPGVSVESASREILKLAGAGVAEFPRPRWADFHGGLLVRPMQEDVTGPVRPSLLAIMGAVVLLLLIAAVNVTNLLLARGRQRRAELAMRAALGASRGRIVRQLLTESVVLAFLGGVCGLGLAHLGVDALIAASPAGLPRVDAIRIDARVFVFAMTLTALIGVVVGLAPSLGSARSSGADGLHHAGRSQIGGGARLRGALVVAEVSLAVVLLVSAGLLYRSVTRLMSVAPGFNPENVITLQVVSAANTFNSDTNRLRFFEQALSAVKQVPGVTTAAATSQLPLSGDIDGYGMEVQSIASTKGGAAGSAMRYAVSPEYFAAMGISLRAGRLIDVRDRPGAPKAIVINESLARRLFGTRNPIGERMHFGPELGNTQPWDYVVGVVGDVKHYSLAADAPDAFYIASGQWQWVDNVQTIVVRSANDPASLVPALKRAIWSVNANLPIQRVQTMDAFVSASAGSRRFVLLVIETFAVVAFVLAAIGLYGVIAGGVVERLREIGVRAAMGAAPSDIVLSVVGRAVALTGLGSLIGIPAALVATRLLQSMLFGVSRVDVVTYLGVISLLAIMAAFAAWAPARKAVGVDPTVALRAD